MVVKSSSRGVQLDQKSHPSASSAQRESRGFLASVCRKATEGEVLSKSDKLGYGGSNAVKSLIVQSLTVSVLAVAVGSSPAVAQFLPPPPPPPASGSPLPVRVPAAPGFPGFPASVPSSVRSEVYTLGAGDRIQMDIFNVPEYSGPNGQHQIQADGSLSLPLIGSLSVAGMTLEQASNAVKERYGKYLKRPWICLLYTSDAADE